MGQFARIAFTPAVKRIQERMGSRAAYRKAEQAGRGPDVLGEDETAFLAERDSFYLASVGEGGWPYVQHRGGPKGFVRVLDPQTLAFADFRGNRQYISVGNVGQDDRVAAIFMDYPNRTRLKVLAHASIVTPDEAPEVMAKLQVPGYDARIERAILLRVEAFDWNCPQHITPRFTEEELAPAIEPLRARLETLEAENRALRERLNREG